jgi:hypothetical protein
MHDPGKRFLEINKHKKQKKKEKFFCTSLSFLATVAASWPLCLDSQLSC